MPAQWKRKRLGEAYDYDETPPKKQRKLCNRKERQSSKMSLRNKEYEKELNFEYEVEKAEEIFKALQCNNHGPCIKCQEAIENPTLKMDIHQEITEEEENGKQNK